jgi:hypothetical protein
MDAPQCHSSKTTVPNLLRIVANLEDSKVQELFGKIAILPQISAPVLQRTAALLSYVFEDSKDLSSDDLIKPPQRSSRLQKMPEP